MARRPSPWSPASILDFWRLLPVELAERPIADVDEAFALFCALADSRQFGTGAARYGEQLGRIACRFSSGSGSPRILDIGCGVGHGTLEIAEALCSGGFFPELVLGITREPLEAWMARTRRLPHARLREQALQRFRRDLPVEFAAGDAASVPACGCFHLIVCNGLLGGGAFSTDRQFRQFLRECLSRLLPGGAVMLANRFHEGAQSRLGAFAHLARRQGWVVRGCTRDLVLSRR